MRLLIPAALVALADCRQTATTALPPQIPPVAAPAVTAFTQRHVDVTRGTQ